MAKDWIKMRTDIYRDPKVIEISDALMDPGSELARFVNQNCQCDMAVTRNVIRGATCGALISVWGIARHQGERKEDDLILHRTRLSTLDDIADIPGFGSAMADVGWVIQDGENLVFPKFFEENNVDPSDKQKQLHRDRQRKYREKRARNPSRHGGATGDATVTHREEKRREENIPDRSGGIFENQRLGNATLREPARVLAWHDWAATQPDSPLAATDDSRIRTLAMALHALEKGEHPIALFASNVGRRKWSVLLPRHRKLASEQFAAFQAKENHMPKT